MGMLPLFVLTDLDTDLYAANARADALRSLVEETEAVKNEYRAMCEWLASHWLHDSDPYEVCLHNDITEADILAAAREAVRYA